MNLPPGWNWAEFEAAVKESLFGRGSIGICIRCGAERDECEPDARNYECWECGEHAVFGAEEILIHIAQTHGYLA